MVTSTSRMFSEGQDEAVSALSRAVRRARSGLAGALALTWWGFWWSTGRC